jgi:hypothetical protein
MLLDLCLLTDDRRSEHNTGLTGCGGAADAAGCTDRPAGPPGVGGDLVLIEENRLLRRQLGGRRFHFTDDDRRRLAVRAYRLGRAALRNLATIATPDTLLRWASPIDRPEVDVRQKIPTARCTARDPSTCRSHGDGDRSLDVARAGQLLHGVRRRLGHSPRAWTG